MNAFDIIIIVIIALAVIFAVRRIYKNRKKGCSCCPDSQTGGCSGICASCGMYGSCEKK